MRTLNDSVMVDDVMGFAVMTKMIDRKVALAFCAPVDRLSGEWDREHGLGLCASRAKEGLTLDYDPHYQVKDYVLEAIKADHGYVPDIISKRVLKLARGVLNQKDSTNKKRAQKATSGEAIYRFHVNCGRLGALEGTFTSTKDDIEALYGYKQIFHDVLAQHSEIAVTYEAKHFTALTEDTESVRVFNELIGGSGINPLNYDEDGVTEWLEREAA